MSLLVSVVEFICHLHEYRSCNCIEDLDRSHQRQQLWQLQQQLDRLLDMRLDIHHILVLRVRQLHGIQPLRQLARISKKKVFTNKILETIQTRQSYQMVTLKAMSELCDILGWIELRLNKICTFYMHKITTK